MLDEPKGFFLAGSREQSDNIATVKSPWDGALAGKICLASPHHLELATVAAVKAVTDFRYTPRHVRSQWCAAIADGLRNRSSEFARLITAESAKPIQYSRGEVARAITTFTQASHEALRFAGEVLPLDIAPASESLTGHTRREPAGIVAAITPFNFPLNLVAHKVAPALAVGCPIILKPAVQTPLTALLLAEVIEQAGVPSGMISVLPMENETAEIMVRDDRIAVLSFTGSDTVGWHLKAISGRKRALLELGGNAPAIVHNDADLRHAVSRLITGSFASSGQVCIKSQRLLVHESLYDAFNEKFVSAARQVETGDPWNPDTIVSALIDTKAADRVEKWIHDAAAGGARILCGGTRDQNVIAPTVLENVPADSPCLRREIFAPVVTLQRYRNLDEAIALANDSEFGLQAALFTYDTRVIEQATRELQFGGIIINDSPSVRVDNYPYGGMKASGLGREGVRYTMEEFSEIKVIVTRQTGD